MKIRTDTIPMTKAMVSLTLFQLMAVNGMILMVMVTEITPRPQLIQMLA